MTEQNRNSGDYRAELILRIWNQEGKLPDDLGDAFAPHAEHVAEMLTQGYTSGQIVDEAFNGWWEILPTSER